MSLRLWSITVSTLGPQQREERKPKNVDAVPRLNKEREDPAGNIDRLVFIFHHVNFILLIIGFHFVEEKGEGNDSQERKRGRNQRR